MSFPKSDQIWMNGKLVPWDGRQDPHRLPRHPLRVGGLRGHPLLRHAARARRSSGSTRTPSASTTPPRSTGWTCPSRPRSSTRPSSRPSPPTRWTPATSGPSSTAATGMLGVNPFPCPVDVAIMVWTGASTSAPEALEKGVDVRVSSWTRIAPNTLPAMAKTAANYMNSQLIKMEAIKDGYVGGDRPRRRGLPLRGQRREPLPGARTATLITPPLVSSVLPGITRDTRHHPRPPPGHPGARERACCARCSTSRTRSS